jgi:hypothetical protein
MLMPSCAAAFDEAIRLDPSFGAVCAHRAENIALMNKLEFEQIEVAIPHAVEIITLLASAE